MRIQSSFIYRRTSFTTDTTKSPQMGEGMMMMNEWMAHLSSSLSNIFVDMIWLFVFLCCLTESMLYLDGKRHFNQTVGHWMQHVQCLKPLLIKNRVYMCWGSICTGIFFYNHSLVSLHTHYMEAWFCYLNSDLWSHNYLKTLTPS